MPFNMFKTVFVRMPITDLNIYKQKVRLCVNNNLGRPQLGICRVKIKHKSIESHVLCSASKWSSTSGDARL